MSQLPEEQAIALHLYASTLRRIADNAGGGFVLRHKEATLKYWSEVCGLPEIELSMWLPVIDTLDDMDYIEFADGKYFVYFTKISSREIETDV